MDWYLYDNGLCYEKVKSNKRYIEEAYNVTNLAYPPYFQIQLILVNVNDPDLNAIQSREVSLFRSIKRKERLQQKILHMYLKREQDKS